MSTKKELEQKKELARLYYMQGESQKVIADKVGVSAVTLGRWVDNGGWKEKKAGMNVTRPEIVNKNLVLISRLLDRRESTVRSDLRRGRARLKAMLERSSE